MNIERYIDLPDELNKKVDKLTDEAFELFNEKRYTESFQLFEKSLSFFPEPKGDYGDYSFIIECMIGKYLEIKDYPNAKKWVEELGLVFKNQHILGDWAFLRGKVYFHSGDFETAWESFNKAYQTSKLDSFREEDPQYLDFLRNPKKYMKNE